jgi:ABC-type branched-subunit amino acid transport system substrate-binding protein
MRSPSPGPVLLGLLLIGCTAKEPARIGDAYPRDSASASVLAAIVPAIESAGVGVSKWSASGSQDGGLKYNAEQAHVFADDPRVIAVVGHPGSRDAILGAAVYNARGVPQVVPNATSSRLGHMGPWTFTLVPSDSIEGAFIAHYALDSLRANRVSVFYLGDEYGIGLRDGVRGALLRRGTDVVDAALIPADGCSVAPSMAVHEAIIVAALRRSRPDVVVVTTGSVNGWCIANIVHDRSPGTWVLFGDGMDGARRVPPGMDRIVEARVRGVEFWTPGTDSLNRAFVDRMQKAMKRPPDASNALQFDAYMLLAAAIREAGADREAVRRWLESLGRTRAPWPGITGPIAFNRPRTEILRMGGPGVLPQ